MDQQDIAIILLRFADEEEDTLTLKHLNQLMYLIQGLHLSTFKGQPLIRQAAYAQASGPTFHISEEEFENLARRVKNASREEKAKKVNLSPQVAQIISLVWENYMDQDEQALEGLTRIEGGPWDQIWAYGSGQGELIPNQLIQRQFESRQ